MGFSLTILGANSAIPTASRYPTAQLLDVYQSFYLIDCGEGTQMQLRRNKIKLQRIGCIFISHLHGDHYFGLVGLLNTMQLLGRQKPLKLYGPPPLKDIIQLQLDEAGTNFTYELEFIPLSYGKSELIHEDKFVKVYTIPLNHRIPCNGFLFEETKKNRKISKETIRDLEIPLSEIPAIKRGADYIDKDGVVYPNKSITDKPKRSCKYAFCSDTKYDESIIPLIRDVDILYHEATFLEDMKERAKKTFHSTAKEAATIAKKAEVFELLIGHFSARYNTIDQHLEEARTVFPNSKLAIEGKVFVCN